MMRKFVRDQVFRDLQLPLPTDTELPNFDFIGNCNVGTVGDMVVMVSDETRKFASLSSLHVCFTFSAVDRDCISQHVDLVAGTFSIVLRRLISNRRTNSCILIMQT